MQPKRQKATQILARLGDVAGKQRFDAPRHTAVTAETDRKANKNEYKVVARTPWPQ
jgi:hypothetical protein